MMTQAQQSRPDMQKKQLVILSPLPPQNRHLGFLETRANTNLLATAVPIDWGLVGPSARLLLQHAEEASFVQLSVLIVM